MIRSFADGETKEALEALRIPPSNRLEASSGDRRGPRSIRINEQWRIRFVWRKGSVFKIEIIDYHS